MIAAWMMFSVVTACALTVAAAAADRLASLSRRPRRFIWLTALVVTALWPAIAVIRTGLVPSRDSSSATGLLVTGVHRLSTFAVTSPAWEIPRPWNSGLLVAWALLTSILMARLALAVWYSRRHRATWPTIKIDGMGVHLAPAAGPAVVGLHPMHIVIPEWVLGIEHPLREIVLRHEAEHRAARDPYLLFVATLVTALIPWNAALWFQARRLRLAIEIDCDTRVLRAHPRWREYALLLLTIAQRRAGTTQRHAPALLEPSSNLERRITAMRTIPTLSRFHGVCLSLAATVAFALACAVDKPQSPDRFDRTQSVGGQANAVALGQSLDPARTTFFEFQVDKPVTARGSQDIHYTAALKSSGISGEVWAQFVVDQTGRVDIGTFKVLKSPASELTAAVKAALPTWRFEPAMIQGKKVKQLVQQSFVFKLPPDA